VGEWGVGLFCFVMLCRIWQKSFSEKTKLYLYIKQILMGLILSEVELINASDMELARRSLIGDDKIKRITINMLVDTGSYNLCINEDIQAQLQLPYVEKRFGKTINNREFMMTMNC
jgi:hypothetical protein